MKQRRILCTMSQSWTRRTFLAVLSALPAAWSQGRAVGKSTGDKAPYVPTFLHPNDRWVVLRGDKDFCYEIVDLETGRCVQTLADSTCSTWYGLPDVRFDPSGRYLVMGYDGTHDSEIRRWDLRAPGAPLVLPGDEVDRERIGSGDPAQESPEEVPQPPLFALPEPGGLLRCARTDRHLKDFTVARRRTVAVPIPLHSELQGEVRTRQGRTWKVEPRDGQADHRIIRALTPQVRRQVASMYGMTGPVGETLRTLPVGLALRRTQDRVLIWTGYSTIREVDATSGDLVRALSGSMPHTGLLAFGRSRATLYASRALDRPFRWNRNGSPSASTGRLGDEPLQPPGSVVGPPSADPADRRPWETRALALGSQGLVLGLNNGELRVGRMKDPHSGPWLTLGRHEDGVRALTCVPDRPWALSGARDGSLLLWDLEKGSLLRRLPPHEARINAACALGAARAATCGPDGIRLWDLDTGALLRHLDTGGAWISDVALSPDGRWVGGALLDGTTRVWEFESGRLSWSASPEAGWCAALAFHPEGDRLTAGYELGQIISWDLRSGARLQRTRATAKTAYQEGPRPVHALTWSADGQALAVAFGDAVRVYDRNLHSPEGPGWLLPLDWADEYT